MLNKFKFAAVALAALVATATFTASTEQAQAAKLSTGARIAIGVGAALLTGAALASRHHAEGQTYYENRRRGYRYDYVSDDDDDGPRYSYRRKRSFDRYDD